ncbi:STAS domain-containing protein [Phycicoccus sp. CSK15P-2]|uniref:STAS domain-containing protein n=1 Tax=Phycicoccus sp. CSK15P-2 TaxID=2807627 RepID=UPI00195231B3|nr:STAS domain-containing protein [Phycicoccus sp. CSK15P-2]MBM6405477.1 STAS domain-containing protein [Phycicoccus sp. CSK15P-2]
MAQEHIARVTMTDEPCDDGTLVRLAGRLDRRTVADVRLGLHELLLETPGIVLLDLDEVVVGDATALGLLVELRRRALRAGSDVRVVAADARTGRLLRRARLSTMLAPTLRGVTPSAALAKAV